MASFGKRRETMAQSPYPYPMKTALLSVSRPNFGWSRSVLFLVAVLSFSAAARDAGAASMGARALTWASTGNLNQGRHNHVAIRLADGRVLVAGGVSDTATLASAELFDPVSGNWTTTGQMSTGRDSAAAVLLQDGRVLVTGGLLIPNALKSCEIYHPSTG